MKFLLVISFVIAGYSARCQSGFEWVGMVQGMNMDKEAIYAHPESGTVVLSHRDETSNYSGAVLLDGAGNQQSLNYQGNSDAWLIQRYDANGKMLWMKTFNERFINVRSINVGPHGRIIMSVYLEYYNEDNDDNEYAIVEDLPNAEFAVGHALIELNNDGSVRKVLELQDIDPETDLYGGDIAYYEDDRIVFSGFVDDNPLLKDGSLSNLGGGGKFICMVDTSGVRQWADVISNRDRSCCTISEIGGQMSVAPDGTIYLAGTSDIGLVLSDGTHSIAPSMYDARNNRQDGKEVYVISYAPSGKINWIQLDRSYSRSAKIAATKDGVFVGHSVKQPVAFGVEIDTAFQFNNVLTFIGNNGKVHWNIVNELGSLDDFKIGPNNDLYITGKINTRDSPPRLSSAGNTLNIDEKHNMYVARVNAKGKVNDIWSDKLYRSREMQFIAIDPSGVVYFATDTWCTKGVRLSINHRDFSDLIECQYETSFVAKIKL